MVYTINTINYALTKSTMLIKVSKAKFSGCKLPMYGATATKKTFFDDNVHVARPSV